MRKRDKLKSIQKANILAERRLIKSKDLIIESLNSGFELVIDEIINGPTTHWPKGGWRYPRDITIEDIYKMSDDRHSINVKGTVTKDGQSADVEFRVDGEHSIEGPYGEFEKLGISTDVMGDFILLY